MRSNALVYQKPPRHFHRLRRTDLFRRIVGRPPTQADYEGIHTTNTMAIAAAYAMGSWDQLGGAGSDAYPVVLALDVAGLKPEVDVDAMMNGRMALDGVRAEVADALARGASLADIYNYAQDSEQEWEAGRGDHPANFIFDRIPREPITALLDALERHGSDEDEIAALLRRFADEGADAVPGIVLSEIVEQQRYLNDFELDRVLQVIAFRPWWEEVLEPWWELEDEQLTKKAQSIEQGGWRLWTVDDAFDIDADPAKVVYDSGRTSEREEYHGTISTAVNEAFPGLIPEEPPFPVR